MPTTAATKPACHPFVTDPSPPAETRCTPPTLGAAEYGLIALQSLLWGSTFFFIALTTASTSPLTLSVIRTAPATLLVLTVVLMLGQRLPANRRDWGVLFLIAAFNNVIPFILIAIAQREVTGGIAAVFNATAPLFAVFLSGLFIADEPLSWRRVAGIVTGIAGVAVLIGANPEGSGSLTAKLLLLAAAACYAATNVITRLFIAATYPPFVVAFSQSLASLIIATVLWLAWDQPWTMAFPDTRTTGIIVLMGILGSGLASLCHFTVLKRAGATNAMLVTIILPLTPILLGAVFLGERLSSRDIAGAAIIAAALLVIDGRVFTLLRPRRAAKRPPAP